MCSQCRNSGPVICLQDGHQETPAPEAAVPWREPGDMCFSYIENFPYARRNGFSTDRLVLPTVTHNEGVTHDQSDFFLKSSVCPK